MSMKREREIDLMSHARPSKIKCNFKEQLKALENLVAAKSGHGASSTFNDDIKIENIKEETQKPVIMSTSFVTDSDLAQLIYKSLVLHDNAALKIPQRLPPWSSFYRTKSESIETIIIDSDDSNDTIIMDSDEYSEEINGTINIDSDDDCYILAANIDQKIENDSKNFPSSSSDVKIKTECSSNLLIKTENPSSSSAITSHDELSIISQNIVSKTKVVPKFCFSSSSESSDDECSIISESIFSKPEVKTNADTNFPPDSSSAMQINGECSLMSAHILPKTEFYSEISLENSSEKNNKSLKTETEVDNNCSLHNSSEEYNKSLNTKIKVENNCLHDNSSDENNKSLNTKNKVENNCSLDNNSEVQSNNEFSCNSPNIKTEVEFKTSPSSSSNTKYPLMSANLVSKTEDVTHFELTKTIESVDDFSNFMRDDEFDNILCSSEFVDTI